MSRQGQTNEDRSAAREVIDDVIRAQECLAPTPDDYEDDPDEAPVGRPLLTGWALVMQYVDEVDEGFTCVITSPGMSYPTRQGLLHVGLYE